MTALFTGVVFFLSTLKLIMSLDTDMADSTPGQVAKCLGRVVAGAAVAGVEIDKVFPFHVRVFGLRKFPLFNCSFFHGKNFFMAFLTGKFSLQKMDIMVKDNRFHRLGKDDLFIRREMA